MIRDLSKEMKQEIKDEQKSYREELMTFKVENETLVRENGKPIEEIKIINKMNNMDRQNRRNNVVMQGLPIAKNDRVALKEMKTFITKNL